MDYIRTRIKEVTHPAPEYAFIRFEGDRPIAGAPGQFVMVRGRWGTDPILPRAFSLVEAGGRGAILVRAVGKGTRLLVEMRKGDPLAVLGPIGNGFTWPDPGRRAVLVAGGVGVAPLVFLAEKLAREGREPTFVYGARSSSDLPLLERLSAISELVVTTEDGSAGEKGLVTNPLDRILERNEPMQLFSCGPEPMLEAVALAAAGAEVPCEVALESPMACGMGTCKGCAVVTVKGDYRYVCSDGPVFDSLALYGGAP